jgi:hypothetical protein
MGKSTVTGFRWAPPFARFFRAGPPLPRAFKQIAYCLQWQEPTGYEGRL